MSTGAKGKDQSSNALVQMPNRQMLEELLDEVKKKVGGTTAKVNPF